MLGDQQSRSSDGIYLLSYCWALSWPQVKEHFLPPLLDAILLDYKRNVSLAREPEVLSTVTSIIDKVCNDEITSVVVDILTHSPYFLYYSLWMFILKLALLGAQIFLFYHVICLVQDILIKHIILLIFFTDRLMWLRVSFTSLMRCLSVRWTWSTKIWKSSLNTGSTSLKCCKASTNIVSQVSYICI